MSKVDKPSGQYFRYPQLALLSPIGGELAIRQACSMPRWIELSHAWAVENLFFGINRSLHICGSWRRHLHLPGSAWTSAAMAGIPWWHTPLGSADAPTLLAFALPQA